MKLYTIDASNKKLGRVATEAARALSGKNQTNFTRNKLPDSRVVIENASKIDLSAQKKTVRKYERYSGYPGGRKISSAADIIKKKGYKELFKITIYGMLPKNKLRAKMIKHLIVNE